MSEGVKVGKGLLQAFPQEILGAAAVTKAVRFRELALGAKKKPVESNEWSQSCHKPKDQGLVCRTPFPPNTAAAVLALLSSPFRFQDPLEPIVYFSF